MIYVCYESNIMLIGAPALAGQVTETGTNMGQRDSSRLEIMWSSVTDLLARLRRAGAQDQATDLTKEESGFPTEHADVFTGNDKFEKRLEDVTFEVRVPFVTIRTGIKTPTRSPVSRSAAAFLLVTAGCMSTAVLHAIGAPQWAQLAGMLLPWAIALSQAAFNRGGGRIA
jgi:hypothetical protein